MPFLLHTLRNALKQALPFVILGYTPPLWADTPSSWLDAVTVSGYAKLKTSSPNRAATAVELDDFSIFVSGKFNRWLNPFIEAEAYAMPLWEAGKGAQFNRAQVIIERLYNDIRITEDNTLRAGK